MVYKLSYLDFITCNSLHIFNFTQKKWTSFTLKQTFVANLGLSSSEKSNLFKFDLFWPILIYFNPIWSKKVNYLDFILCTLKMRTSTLFFFNLRHRHVKPIERWHPNDSSSINMYLSPHWPRWRLFKRNNPISKKEVKNLLLIISEIREIVNLTLKTY